MPTKINLEVSSDNNNVKVSCERTTHRYGDDKYHSNIGYVNAIFKNGRDADGKFAKPQVN
jgi:predicted transcriptional regulator with HTH domain